MNCLLDYGADVNKLNYEGLSPLAACHVLFYSRHTWNENIGETITNENLFNSVYWDTQTGTFVQRKHTYKNYKISSKIDLISKDSNSNWKMSDKSEHKNFMNYKISTGSTGLVKTTTTCKIPTESDIENICNPIASKVEKNIVSNDHVLHDVKRNQKMPDRSGKETNSVETVKSVTSKSRDIHNSRNDSIALNLDDGETALLEVALSEGEISHQSSEIKKSIVQHSQTVDKNTFIQVFLNRAASARSKQSSFFPFGNISSVGESGNIQHNQDANSQRLTGDHVDEKAERHPVQMVTMLDIRDSAQYSIENAISSSLQSSSTLDSANSLKCEKQNRQKLLTEQRYIRLYEMAFKNIENNKCDIKSKGKM